MCDLLRPGGLLIITGAFNGREEHGTINHYPHTSPFTTGYYKNVTLPRFRRILPMSEFVDWEILIKAYDLRFWGIKKL